jgi:HPt (histidine-containing phosphotransfer) domain-containing protein
MSSDRDSRAIDHTIIDEYRSMADDAFVASLIEQYLAESALQIAAIEAAMAGREFDLLHAVAHALKGASSTIGAATLAVRCGEIEAAIRQRSLDTLRPLVAALATEYHGVREELRTLLGERVVVPGQ